MATSGTANNRLARVPNSQSTRNASNKGFRSISLNMKFGGQASEIISPRGSMMNKSLAGGNSDMPAFNITSGTAIPDGALLRNFETQQEKLHQLTSRPSHKG